MTGGRVRELLGLRWEVKLWVLGIVIPREWLVLELFCWESADEADNILEMVMLDCWRCWLGRLRRGKVVARPVE